ncbi:hypothetical protein DMH17_16785, partial [Raoultella planticola]|nr:hypothetical protein [Raoultella planticola]
LPPTSTKTQRDKPVEIRIAARLPHRKRWWKKSAPCFFTSDKPQLRYPVTLVTHAVRCSNACRRRD